MRFLDLRLIAYGPFTDHILDLSGGTDGLHVVYGANEAGKSASLRAISALLYGIPPRCPDNFRHPYPDLRVGARLRHSSGAEEIFIRRKGRENTLLDANANPVPDDALARYLGIADAALFAHLHGINHEMLLAGGLEMKNLKGHIGATLFSAGLGSGINTLLSRLAEEEKFLAAPRSAQGVTTLLSTYKKLKKESNDLALRGGEWQEADRASSRLRDEITALNEAIISLTREHARLGRMVRNLPRYARRARLQAEIEALQPIITLPSTYAAEARQQAVATLGQALAGEERLDRRLAAINGQLTAIQVPQPLLSHGEQIEHLFQERNTHLTAATDRGNHITKRIQYENDARRLLRDLAPKLALEQVEQLRLTRADLERLRELCVAYQVMHERPRKLAEAIAQLGREEERLAAELTALPAGGEPLPLKNVLKDIARHGDLEQKLRQAEELRAAAGEEARRGLTRLGSTEDGEPGLRAIIDTIYPAPETIDRFDARFRQLEQEEQRLAERREETTLALDRSDTEIDALRNTGRIPSEEDLLRLRTARDTTWQQIKQVWIERQPPATSPEELAATYEGEVNGADATSDRLRREADRVQQLARHEGERAAALRRRDQIHRQGEELAGRRRQLEEAWREAWRDCRISPATPGEMRGWLSRREQVVLHAGRYFEADRQVRTLTESVAAARCLLSDTLAHYGEVAHQGSLAELIDRAEAQLDHLNGLAMERERLARTLADRKSSREEKSADFEKEKERLAAWQEVWHQAVAKLPLDPAGASPGQVTAVIDRLDALFDRVGKLHDTNIRIRAIEKNRARYRQAVVDLAQAVAPELADQDDTEAIAQLHQKLSRARTEAVTAEGLRRQQEELTEERRELADTVAKARVFLTALCNEVGCTGHEALPEIELRWGDFQRLRDALRQVEEEIVNDGGGQTLAERAAEIEGVDADLLGAQIDSFENDLRELNRQKEEKGRELYELEAKLAQMDGNDRAAEAAEQATLVGAEVGQAVQRYLRVKLAGALLRRRIEEHRRNSQSPVLALANTFFQRITGGRFSELATDFDVDQQILVGVRTDGTKVRVEEMSDGTRDQLYLALRLAHLDHELGRGGREPMPLVLDDLLMNFDDERAAATLQLLAELSDRTQIIYFTHHAHLLELTRQAVAAETLHIHRL